MDDTIHRTSPSHYWFKPKKFGIFAGYYPVSWAGALVTLVALSAFIWLFITVDSASHSVWDTLFGIAPGTLIILLIFDIISFRTGEYPSWWRKWHDAA